MYRLIALLLACAVAVGSVGCGREENRSRLAGEAKLSFAGLPDGPAPADFGGPSWVGTSPPKESSAVLRVQSGVLTNDPSSQGTVAAYYSSGPLNAPITKIGARWKFIPRGGTPGALAIIVSEDKVEPPFSVHLVLTPTTWAMGVWGPEGTADAGLKVLASQFFDVPLKQDGETIYETSIDIEGERADITLPDGQHEIVKDPRIAQWAGSLATFEAYSQHAPTDSRIGFSELWAQSWLLQ